MDSESSHKVRAERAAALSGPTILSLWNAPCISAMRRSQHAC